MRGIKILFGTTALLAGLALTPAVESQLVVEIGVQPVCSYGYYGYAPYACAPYGYYGPSWFSGGLFIGAGPWYHGWGRVNWYHPGAYYGPRFYGRSGFYGRPGPVFRGGPVYHGPVARGPVNGFHGGAQFHGGSNFHGGGSVRGGGGFHGGGGGRR